MTKPVIFSVLSVTLLITFVSMLTFKYAYLESAGPLAEEKTIIIPKGTSVRKIAQILGNEEIIDAPQLFPLVFYLYRENTSLKAGEYAFSPGITPLGVLYKLSHHEVVQRRMTFPEGWSSAQIAVALASNEALTGDMPAQISEGSLFPDTYVYHYGDTRVELLKHMQQRHREVMDALWAQYKGAHDYIKNAQDTVILASIIEKETGQSSERRKVAGVFHNRLRRGMKLQSDPTALYAITKGESELGRPLTRKDLEVDSPYNTYQHEGLPPGPICNPGRASLEAALNPEKTGALYFVADGEGAHRFARTLEEHNRNVQKYRRWVRENAGK